MIYLASPYSHPDPEVREERKTHRWVEEKQKNFVPSLRCKFRECHLTSENATIEVVSHVFRALLQTIRHAASSGMESRIVTQFALAYSIGNLIAGRPSGFGVKEIREINYCD